MGNCCGSEEKKNFQGEGRTLAASPTNAPPQSYGTRATVPSSAYRTDDSSNNARQAAARAAEERANAARAPGGKLQNSLHEQRGKTQEQLLQQSAYENRRYRETDSAAQARNYQ